MANADIRQEFLEGRQRSFYVRYIAHLMEGAKADSRGRMLGLSVVILSTIVGTSIFASLQTDSPNTWVKIGVGGLSVLAAVMAAVKEFEGYGKRSAEHLAAAATYGQLRHRAEAMIVDLRQPVVDKAFDTELADLDKDFDKEQAVAPALPDDAYSAANAVVDAAMKDRANGLTVAF